jgi:serine/threonine-protein kinase
MAKMGPRISRLGLLALAFVVLLATVGCAADPYVAVADWNLRAPDGTSHAVHAPQRFDELLPKQPAVYSLEADVQLPDSLRGRTLTLTWPLTYAFATLVVDGEEILPLSLAPTDRIHPSHLQLVFRIPAGRSERETLHLELKVQHVDFWTARLVQAPRLAAAPYGEWQLRTAQYVSDALVTSIAGTFLLLAAAAGISFVLDRRRKADGWFAALTLAVAVWHGAAAGLFQVVDSRDLVRPIAVSTTLMCVCIVGFTSAYLGLKPPRLVWLALVALGVASAVLGWPPFASNSRTQAFQLAEVALALLYVITALVRLARQRDRRSDALGMLAAWSAPAISSLMHDARLWPGYVHPVPFGFLICIVTLAVLLVRRHARELRALNAALEERVVTLEDRNREVRSLYDELRRQIHERSARLADAFTRIGRLSGGRLEAPRVGAVVGERYRIVRVIGEGGMGTVYEVERTNDGRRFALKVLVKAESGDWLARLAREAQAATAVVHPHVVSMVDVDVEPSGSPFLVMELVQGQALSTHEGRFGDATFARELVRQLALGLAALHEAGIVHRDLKPSNVLLEERPGDSFCAKIADFGIARVATDPAGRPVIPARRKDDKGVLDTDGLMPFLRGELDEDAPMSGKDAPRGDPFTRTGWVAGTPHYMAPELARGVKDAAPSCDLWSLGVVAFQVGCGKLPFREPPVNWTDDDAWRPPTVDTRALADPLRSIVERCLEGDPARRPTAAEVAAALA